MKQDNLYQSDFPFFNDIRLTDNNSCFTESERHFEHLYYDSSFDQQ